MWEECKKYEARIQELEKENKELRKKLNDRCHNGYYFSFKMKNPKN